MEGGRPPPTRDDTRFARREAARVGVATNKKPASAPRSFAAFIPTGEEMLDQYLEQLDAEPENYGLALAMGRMAAETGRAELMSALYRHLIKANQLIDEIAAEVEGLLDAIDSTSTRRQLSRVLGDVYSKQGRYREAMAAYSSTFER
ncbi:MAG: hypothetical protein HC822_17215 [Oscillochloris sp.]|nr:hypothetical protein [Oscillochloris sp.]